MKRKIINALASMAIVVFAMAAGAACYHQYLVQHGLLRTSQPVYIPTTFCANGGGGKYTCKRK